MPVQPVQDIFGLSRLADQIRANRQEAAQAPIRAAQTELLQGRVQQQRQGLADLARTRQEQTDLQAAIQEAPDQDVDRVSLDFFRKRSPAKAQQFEKMIFDRAAGIAKFDPQGASEFLNLKTGSAFDFTPAVTPAQTAAKEKAKFGQAKDIRAEVTKASKTFNETENAFGRIKAVTKTPSAAGDLALIFNFMKMLDPGSVVRESEFKTAEQARAWMAEAEGSGVRIPAFVAQGIQKLSTGQKLLPEQRTDFLAQSGNIFNELKGRHDQTVENFVNLGKRFGLEREDIIVGRGAVDVGETGQETQETVVISNHPLHGDVTESDIAETVKQSGLSRAEVIERLQQEGQ